MDTNVLVSSVITDGPPRRVLELIADGMAEMVLPAEAVEELERVLVTKLGLDPAGTTTIVATLSGLASAVIATSPDVAALSGDPDDEVIAAAVSAGADTLVSGDRRHVLPLGRVNSMRIMSAQALVAELLAAG